MKEVEVKLLEVKELDLRDRLRILGAVKFFEGEVETMMFDDAEESLQRKGDLLRLRRMGGSVTLTYKKYVEDPHAKVREELEVMVADLETAKKILENLGFQQKHAIRKHRTSYRLQDARLEFDRHLGEHSFIPEFMEIEGKDAEQLPKVMEKLGLRQEDARDWSFFEVAEHYKARGG